MQNLYYPGGWNAPPAMMQMETGGDDEPIDTGYTTGVEVACPACENNALWYALAGGVIGFILAGMGKRQ